MNAFEVHLSKLGLAEKLQLVQQLWDDIASNAEELPVLEWQKQELARRKTAYLKHPRTGSSWEQAKARIRNR
ncbi:MAG: addiction module protein [Microcoleus sp. CAN_BIN18]|nr:addiction module protein [Microcoleus sp. CAN_BIN18]